MLHFLLKWQTYRNFKNGLLVDFLTKRFLHNISKYLFYTFTIFFGDKYILENFYTNFNTSLKILTNKIKNINKNSFINLFRTTLFIIIYLIVVFIIFNI